MVPVVFHMRVAQIIPTDKPIEVITTLTISRISVGSVTYTTVPIMSPMSIGEQTMSNHPTSSIRYSKILGIYFSDSLLMPVQYFYPE